MAKRYLYNLYSHVNCLMHFNLIRMYSGLLYLDLIISKCYNIATSYHYRYTIKLSTRIAFFAIKMRQIPTL